MISSIDFKLFGIKIKEVRECLGYTQKQVQELCGLNRDTLRRIELGVVTPRYDTLEILSQVYKLNLLKFIEDSINSKTLLFLKKLDNLILNYSQNEFEEINDVFINLNKKKSIQKELLVQYEFILRGIKELNSRYIQDRNECIQTLSNSIKLDIKNFSVYNIESFVYSELNLKSIFLLASAFSKLKNYKQSNILYKKFLETFPTKNSLPHKFIIKTYLEISKNNYSILNFSESLSYAKTGILFCLKNDLLYKLDSLYLQKSNSELKLNSNEYKESLKKSKQISEIINLKY